MSTNHMMALKQAEQLERISDQNLVLFYESELGEIDKGGYASGLLNSNVLRRLIRLGILERSKWKGRGRRRLVLTEKARYLLESRETHVF